jgi:hypothetical protein
VCSLRTTFQASLSFERVHRTEKKNKILFLAEKNYTYIMLYIPYMYIHAYIYIYIYIYICGGAGEMAQWIRAPDCSSEGLEFKFQQPYGGSQPSVMSSDSLFWSV